MPQLNQIRAHYDASTITVYQAYSPTIARLLDEVVAGLLDLPIA